MREIIASIVARDASTMVGHGVVQALLGAEVVEAGERHIRGSADEVRLVLCLLLQLVHLALLELFLPPLLSLLNFALYQRRRRLFEETIFDRVAALALDVNQQLLGLPV